jgi:protein FAM32A
MGDYDIKPSGSLKLKGVKDKKIKKSKKDKAEKAKEAKEETSPEKDTNPEAYAVPRTEAERRFDEIQRQRLEKKIEKNAVKSHRERVDDMNKFLDSLSDVCWSVFCPLTGSTMTCRKLDQAKALRATRNLDRLGKE